LVDRLIATVERLNQGPLDDDVAVTIVNHDPSGGPR
jgi:hypothetical protein